MKIVPLLLLFLSAFAGCAVGPNYEPPQTGIEPSYGAAATQPAEITDQAVATRWWTTLHDPLLDSLIGRAVAANLDVKLAQARVREARARWAVAAGGRYPDADVAAGVSRQRVSQNAAPFNAFNIPGFPWEYNLFQAGFDASWEIDVFGGVRRGIEAAGGDLGASVEGRRAVLLSVMAEVARNYLSLRSDQQRRAIAEKNLAAQRQTLDLTRELARNGVVSGLDASRAAAQVSTTEAQLPTFRAREAQAIHRLAVLIGEQPDALSGELSRAGAIPAPPARVSVGIPAELLRRRPDIRRAERELAAATARVGEASAELYPRFSLTGSFSLQSASLADLVDWRSRAFSIGPSVRWPIFDAGRLRAAVEIRSAEQEQALVRYQQAVLAALQEVHDAIVGFTNEEDRRRSLAAAVAANRDSAELLDSLYRQGLADFLAVLDAERSLYQSEDALAQSEGAAASSLVALYKALGGGWEVEDETQPNPPAATKPADEQGVTDTQELR